MRVKRRGGCSLIVRSAKDSRMLAHKNTLRKIEKNGSREQDMPLWRICRDQVGRFLMANVQTVD
jgi:hypothetical protein